MSGLSATSSALPRAVSTSIVAACRLLIRAGMHVVTIDRDAAFIAARAAQMTIEHATSGWPPDVARSAHKAAADTVAAVLGALKEAPTSAARRKGLRDALCSALELAAICDIALAYGLGNASVHESLRCASRTLSMLGMSFHATAAGRD